MEGVERILLAENREKKRDLVNRVTNFVFSKMWEISCLPEELSTLLRTFLGGFFEFVS
jgi:hypothetical protein